MGDEKIPPGKPKPPEPPPSASKPAFDPFKAEDPVLPGVPAKKVPAESPGEVAQAEEAPPRPKLDFKDPKVMAGSALALAFLVLIAWLVFGPSDVPSPVASSTAGPASTPAPGTTSGAGGAAEPAIVALPGEVGTIEEFAQPWHAKKVLLQKATGRVPGLIIRLPGGSPRRPETYWGLLLTSPYGRCELEFVADLKRIADDYGYRARHPMVVDPCNLTVFNPLRMGDVGGTVARGEPVQGTALRPPLAIDIRIEGNRIIAVQTE